ncbi:MAG TPA: type II secretion system secretin GspD [Candidatus Acidoferrum sp.]|nr:type II secretion system secretin GspD [Candidatus Acidoferrum sp.]
MAFSFSPHRLRNSLHRVVLAVALVLVGTAVLAQGPQQQGQQQQNQQQQSGAEPTWTVNYRDGDIRELITFVADATGKTLIVDPAVKGSVQVISSKAVNRAELYQLFLSILKVHGYAAVEAGDVVRILPAAMAREQAVPLSLDKSPGNGGGVVTQVIQVANVAAEQLVPILRPLAAAEAQMTAYTPSNSIVITDSAANIERIRTMVQFIDRSSVKQTQIVTLKNAAAADVVGLLVKLRGAGETAANAPVQLVADERTNSIIVSGEQVQIAKYLPLINQLDSPLTQDGKVNVVNLQYARAEVLAPLLSGLIGSGAAAPAPAGKEGAAPAGGNAGSVVADTATNSLIITADAETLQTLKNVIARLDIRKAQVLVEAIIVELSGDRGKDIGVQWLFENDKGFYGSSSTGSATSSAIAGAALAGAQRDASGNPVDIRAPLAQALASVPGQVLGVGRLGSDLSFNVLLTSLETEKTANILSTPSLLTLDNEQAVITVGRKVPFVTGSYTSTGNTSSNPGNPFQTVERVNVGITLKVTPHVNEGDSLVLQLSQEVSSLLDGSTLLNNNPITNERKIDTTVLANDGQTVVLGGLIEDSLNQNNQKVPLLGDIPGIGRLFRSTSDAGSKTHLMVFLRASIMRENRQMEAATALKYSAIRAEQLEKAGSTSQPLPLLPEWQLKLQQLQQGGGSTPAPAK